MSIVRILRIFLGGLLLVVLACIPMALGADQIDLESGRAAEALVLGLSDLGYTGVFTYPVLIGLGVWLIFNRDDSLLRFRSSRVRAARAAREVGNSMIVAVGGLCCAFGAITSLYAAVVEYTPHLITGPRPDLSLGISGAIALTGLVIYGVGRITR